MSGDNFWGTMADVSNRNNTTRYENAANLLQVMIVNPRVDHSFHPQLFCTRVNTTQLQDFGESAAHSARYDSATLLVFAVNWTFVTSIYAIV